MEFKKVLIQLEGLDGAGFIVGGFDLPSHELGGAVEDGIVRLEFKGVLRLGAGLFAAAVELQGVEHEEIIHGRPIGVGLGAFLQKFIVVGHRCFLEHRLVGEGGGELFVDLGEDAWQIPGLEIIRRGGTGAGTLDEAPAVLLEVVPVPVGDNGGHHRLHFGGRLFDLGLHAADLFLRLVALDGAFKGDLLADRLDGLGIILVGQGFFDNRVEMGDGRFGQAFFQSRVVGFPVAFLGELGCGGRLLHGVEQGEGNAGEGQAGD